MSFDRRARLKQAAVAAVQLGLALWFVIDVVGRLLENYYLHYVGWTYFPLPQWLSFVRHVAPFVGFLAGTAVGSLWVYSGVAAVGSGPHRNRVRFVGWLAVGAVLAAIPKLAIGLVPVDFPLVGLSLVVLLLPDVVVFAVACHVAYRSDPDRRSAWRRRAAPTAQGGLVGMTLGLVGSGLYFASVGTAPGSVPFDGTPAIVAAGCLGILAGLLSADWSSPERAVEFTTLFLAATFSTWIAESSVSFLLPLTSTATGLTVHLLLYIGPPLLAVALATSLTYGARTHVYRRLVELE